jgi:hypothetical protein
MKEMHDDVVVPELLAYKERDRWKAYCDPCQTWHVFRGLGLQPGRCPVYTPNAAHVTLVNGGKWSPSKRVKYIESRM